MLNECEASSNSVDCNLIGIVHFSEEYDCRALLLGCCSVAPFKLAPVSIDKLERNARRE